MRAARPVSLALAAAIAAAAPGAAQGTAADYERAARLAQQWRDGLVRFPARVHWLNGGAALWFDTGAPGDGRCVRVDVATGARTTAPSAAELGVDAHAAALPPRRSTLRSRDGGAETAIRFENGFDRELLLRWIDADGAAHDYGTVPADGAREQHTFAGHVWRLEFADGEVAGVFAAAADGGTARVDDASRRRAATPSPQNSPPARAGGDRADPPWFVRDHDVWLRLDDGTEVRLTDDGRVDDRYRPDLHPSPDGRWLLAFQEEPEQEHTVTLVESSPPDGVQPKVHTLQYLKPGDRIARPRPRLFDVRERRRIDVDEAPFADAWSLGRVHWAPDGSEVHVLYDRRGHQYRAMRAIAAATGAVRTVVEERSDTFVDYSQKTMLRWLDGTGELLWASERDGNCHLYLIDVATGALRQLTRGDWRVRAIDHVDTARREVWITALAIHPQQDPYHRHLARVALDASPDRGDPMVLTAADGDHEWEFAPDRRHFVARWSRVDQPWVTELRRSADGALLQELGRDDATDLLAGGYRPPERFVAKGRDGATDIHGILIRPSTFDPARRYPVLESIYAGPHDFHVPKTFGPQRRERALAELGFVVVQIDGMGTNWRSKAFHDVCWRDLEDAGFPDRIAWLRAAAAAHPELDLARVGVFGGSAGGQNALAALLWHGDFYRAAAADCGCHDNRMDKIWWNEAWMGWPVGDWYADSSNVVHAHRLQGHLLLTVGELDRNVDPASTLQVVDALLRAGKEFEFVLVPGAGHGAGERPALARRRQDFFVRHLLGVEPRRAGR
ncbi:MAG: prolyl oligopeptidase family serine peptidase [Planctomycetota bacterium]